MALSCVVLPAARDDDGLLERDPAPPGGGGVRIPDIYERCADRGEARPAADSRLAVPFRRGPAAADDDVAVEPVRLDTLDTLALRGVV